jgi:hypothetical protein
MPPNLAAFEIKPDNFLEESRNILYAFINYYAHTATAPVPDPVPAWGTWISVSAKPAMNAAAPGDLDDKCSLVIDRVIPLAPRKGNYPEQPTGEDHLVARRCSALVTLQTHRNSRYRLEEAYAKFADLIENRSGQLATKDMRRFIVSQPYAPNQTNVNPDIAVIGILLEFEVTYQVELVRY